MLIGCLGAAAEDAELEDESGEAPKSVAHQVIDALVDTDVFHEELLGKLMSKTNAFRSIAKSRSSGTSEKSMYFLTPGGFRCAAKYGDAFHCVVRGVLNETRELMVEALGEHLPECVHKSVKRWGIGNMAHAKRILIEEAAVVHVDAWDDFDLDGRLTGGDDAILDTSSGQVVVRECTFDDHVSYNVGYNVSNVISNRTTAEYAEFKAKLLRIIKEPGHRDFLLPLVANVVLNGHIAWLLKLIMAVCGPKDSAKSTLFMYVLAAIGDYGGNIDYNELTSGQATGSSNDAAMRIYLGLKRFCLIDEGQEEDADQARGRKRMLHSRIKSFMGGTPKKARASNSLNYSEVTKFPFFCITLNQSNMFAKPANKDDLDRWLLINATSLASFKSGVVDGDAAHVYAKDPDFVKSETIKKNRLHMLSLLCEYYDAGFDPEVALPADLRRIRDEWDYKYDASGSPSAAVDAGPPAPYYVVHEGSKTSEEAFADLVQQVAGMCKRAKGKLVTLKVCFSNLHLI